MPERDVHLLLSQKAAGILKEVIEVAIPDVHEEDVEEILLAIYNDIGMQMPRKGALGRRAPKDVISVPCPTCSAKKGGRCVNSSGRVVKGFHKKRTQAFREAQ